MVPALLTNHTAVAAGCPSYQHPDRRFNGGKRSRSRVRCCSSPPAAAPPLPLQSSKLMSRRAAAAALIVFHYYFSSVSRADAGSPFDKYVKRKKLDPLETYVPAVILTQAQFKYLETSLDLEKPEYDITRSLLRSGPAASLRINIRAMAQYASEDGKGKAATDAVDQCLRALEDLDSLLLHASRNDSSASVGVMRQKINTALVALDNLLETVPAAVLDKGKIIADSYLTHVDPTEGSRAELPDRDVEQLKALL
ncbi:unnamed protein product [Spirodela intermedia]|uniref:DUF7880 domain-containing protein n=1 Tax=Spirodela intermedia TaxID=51605 RepID=A0A7I8KSM5_SPIIN|nr:unnamed protein product [Spirodela intermedia]